MITAFILSQVGEKQNELVFSNNPIDKQELSKYLYTIPGGLLDKNSFFRCFRMRHEIVMAHYWKTTYREIKSGRHGLFVIIGFIIEDALLPNYDSVIGYCKQFLRELQEEFYFSFSSPVSDSLFSRLQLDTDDKIERLKMRFQNTTPPVPKIQCSKIWRNRYAIPWHIPQALYCLEAVDDLTNWEIFFFEALHYINQGCWDISSCLNISPVSVQILNKEDDFPRSCSKVTFKQYQQCPYLVVFY